MHKVFVTLVPFGLSFLAQPVFAENEQLQKLLLKNNCLACHLVDKSKYGPKLKDVAEKYAGESNATDTLAAKIKAGGTGVWGEDIMPPQPQVSDEDARALAESILNLK